MMGTNGHTSYHDESPEMVIPYRVGQLEKRVDKHEERIDRTEKYAAKVSGALGFLKWALPLTAAAMAACVGAMWEVSKLLLEIVKRLPQ